MKEKISHMWLKMKESPRWWKWTLGILISFLIAGGAFATKGDKNGTVVTTDIVKNRVIERSVISNGRLESANKQEFFTPVDSTLMELAVKVGDKVKKGQMLGRLDTLELGRQYEEAKAKLAMIQADLASAMANSDTLLLESAEAQYTKAKNSLDRVNYLFKEGAVTAQELETAKVDYAQAKKGYEEAKITAQQNSAYKKVSSFQAQVDLALQEIAQAKERLDLATFVAKEDGVVLYVGAEKGNRVMEGSRILVVGSDCELKVTASINELDAGGLEVGQPVRITCANLPDQEYQGEVTRVAAVAVSDNANGNENISVPVTIELKENTTGLRPGYTVDLNIITMQKKDFLTVPFEALVNKNGQEFVYVVESGTAKERIVKTQEGNELYDIVLSGLKEGDKVILNPPQQLKDGQKVTIGGRDD